MSRISMMILGAASLMTMSGVAYAKRGGNEGSAAPEPEVQTEATTATADAGPNEKKSIVPSKYAGKYKGGGTDPLAEFIKAESTGKDGFEFTAFFALCRKNGLPEDKVAHYEGQVNAKIGGAAGRARMTLRNMLATIARKNGKLTKLDGTEQEVVLPKPAVSGAAAKAAEDKAAA